jgi:hypothetical protein
VGSGNTTWVQTDLGLSTAHTYTYTLLSTLRFTFRVYAVNSLGDGTPSAEIVATGGAAPSPPGGVATPSTPGALSVLEHTGSATSECSPLAAPCRWLAATWVSGIISTEKPAADDFAYTLSAGGTAIGEAGGFQLRTACVSGGSCGAGSQCLPRSFRTRALLLLVVAVLLLLLPLLLSTFPTWQVQLHDEGPHDRDHRGTTYTSTPPAPLHPHRGTALHRCTSLHLPHPSSGGHHVRLRGAGHAVRHGRLGSRQLQPGDGPGGAEHPVGHQRDEC